MERDRKHGEEHNDMETDGTGRRRLNGMEKDGMAWIRTGWHGEGRDGMERDGTGCNLWPSGQGRSKSIEVDD